jgi:hypothetical protein
MANELEILTENAAGDGWVDSVPGPVSTGYAAQNTNIQARTVGQDLSSVRVSGTDVIVDISGPIDVDGLPFSVTSPITLTPVTSGPLYIQVVAGATGLQKSFELTDSTPVWDSEKNGYYSSGNRVLNWVINYNESNVSVSKIIDNSFGAIGSAQRPNSAFSFVRKTDLNAIFFKMLKGKFNGPEYGCQGLSFDGTNLISAGGSTDTIYVHDGITGAISSSFAGPSGVSILGLTIYRGNLISSSPSTLYIHSGISASISSSFSLPSRPGLAMYGNNLLSCTGSTLYIHSGISASILSSFSLPGSSCRGIAYDGNNLISMDSGTGLIYIHDGVSSRILYSTSAFAVNSSNIWGLTFAHGDLLSAESVPLGPASNIYRYGI